MTDIDQVLEDRGNNYGTFLDNANLTQMIKGIYRSHKGWSNLTHDKREALDMIVHKVSRILNGDPEFLDSWVDIVGYTQLVVNAIREKEKS